MKIYVPSQLRRLIYKEEISALLIEELPSCTASIIDIFDSSSMTSGVSCDIESIKLVRIDDLSKEERIQLGSGLFCIDSKGWLANPHKAYHFVQIKKQKPIARGLFNTYIPDFDGVSRYNEKINSQ